MLVNTQSREITDTVMDTRKKARTECAEPCAEACAMVATTTCAAMIVVMDVLVAPRGESKLTMSLLSWVAAALASYCE